MNETFDSVMSDDVKYRVVRQLTRLLALKWSADQGRPVPPWHDPLDDDGWVDDDLIEMLCLWFPDLQVIPAWHALSPALQAWVSQMTGVEDREPDHWVVLDWPWARDAAHRAALQAAWPECMAPVSHCVVLFTPAVRGFTPALGEDGPVIGLFTEDLVGGDETVWELAHHAQALRARLELAGYQDPEEVSS